MIIHVASGFLPIEHADDVRCRICERIDRAHPEYSEPMRRRFHPEEFPARPAPPRSAPAIVPSVDYRMLQPQISEHSEVEHAEAWAVFVAQECPYRAGANCCGRAKCVKFHPEGTPVLLTSCLVCVSAEGLLW